LSAEVWGALSWDLQETYMFGMAEDPNVPFTFTEDSGRIPAAPNGDGPQVREADTGAQVFDIRGMIAGLENDPDARKRT
jgi:hypothetical protein